VVRGRYEADSKGPAAAREALTQTDGIAAQLAQLVDQDDQGRLLRRRPPPAFSMRGQQPGAGVDYAIGGPQQRRALVGADSPTIEHHLPGSEFQAVAAVDTPENDVAPGRQLGGDDVQHAGLAAADCTGNQHVLAKQGDLNGAASAERTQMNGVCDAL